MINVKLNKLILMTIFLACCAGAMRNAYAQRSKQPNIVIMMTDNLGYGDLGVYGGMRANTPRIDQFASEGVRFRDFQVEPSCSPTRAALMTGRMPIRSGNSDLLMPGTRGGMHTREITIAEVLKEAGYKTSMYGKWHLGELPDKQPQNQGFDEFMGILFTSNPTASSIPGYDPNFFDEQQVLAAKGGQEAQVIGILDVKYRAKIDREITDRSVDYIRSNAKAEQPYFLFVSFTNPHNPVIPHPDFAGKSGGGAYPDVLMEIDFNTGRILDAIAASGTEDDTVVVWMSDNGPTRFSEPDQNGDPGPWTGELGSGWEGGLRTAGMMRWPGKIESNWVSDEMIHAMDLFVTLAVFAGAEVPDDRPIDGFDQSGYLLGKSPKSSRDHSVVFYQEELVVVRWRQFKIHFIAYDREHGMMRPKQVLDIPHTFNLRMDPKERHNISAYQGGFPLISSIMRRVVAPYMKSMGQYPNKDYSKMSSE